MLLVFAAVVCHKTVVALVAFAAVRACYIVVLPVFVVEVFHKTFAHFVFAAVRACYIAVLPVFAVEVFHKTLVAPVAFVEVQACCIAVPPVFAVEAFHMFLVVRSAFAGAPDVAACFPIPVVFFLLSFAGVCIPAAQVHY